MTVALVRILAIQLAVALLVACTAMPTITAFGPTQQNKLSSASHWQIIARDVSWDVRRVIQADAPPCVVVGSADLRHDSQFMTFLTAAVTEELVSPQAVHVAETDKRNIDSKDTVAGGKNAKVYSVLPSGHECNVITLKTAVIEHKGPVARSYPGKYTVLAAGLVGIRNVVRAFTEAKFVGVVAAAEAAFWLSAGFRTSDTITELTITTSYVDSEGLYLAEDTNVYYIDTSDSALYRPPEVAADAAGSPGEATPNKPPWPSLEEDLVAVAPEEKPNPPVKARRLEAYPKTISVCDPTAEFIVRGEYLSPHVAEYMLGIVTASKFGPTAPEDSEQPQTVQVSFTGLDKANFGRDELTLAMVGSDGVPSTARINVDGDLKSCPAQKAANNGAAEAGPANVVLPPAAAESVKIEVCQGRWSLAVSGTGAADVKSAEITEGKHSATVSIGKGGTPVLTFDPLTEYRGKALPAGDRISIQLTNGEKKTFSESIAATCTSTPDKGQGQVEVPKSPPPPHQVSPQQAIPGQATQAPPKLEPAAGSPTGGSPK